VTGGHDVDEAFADRLIVEAEQPLRFVVDQRDPALRVGCDRAFLDPVQDRLTLLEERGDLLRLETEGLALHPAREQR